MSKIKHGPLCTLYRDCGVSSTAEAVTIKAELSVRTPAAPLYRQNQSELNNIKKQEMKGQERCVELLEDKCAAGM